jgi:hypothetical protein
MANTASHATKVRPLEVFLGLVDAHFFEISSLLIATGALIYAALALRVAKEALASAKGSDLAALKLKAQEARVRAERSFLSLQTACHETQGRWDDHHDRHYPKLGSQDFRSKDTLHIAQVERQGRELLRQLEIALPEAATSDSVALEEYIRRANQTVIEIEQLILRLSPPRQLLA